ncbi:DNA polymerase-3 subunit gamma/tau [Trueperella bonasi]|uniref:DNA polymerase III subunit gamma/tau n=1 Tax=Trueperella bonasi TaxID=312286 RepID=A0ABT9NGT3_9ACTO|nr:DNA polymerase III subunit gamma and tau [Trueperella bonasi]MDP9806203.1 DNA polymerase-3 subunit gamma/tau [Trueperella bonasi]
MSVALYRRYRPETFQEVIGQDHVVQPLMAALEAGRTTHAYLFSGPRGCGKTTSARILARALNCAQYPTATPCGTCDSCMELAREGSGSLDVVEMDAASHGGVDDARELREQAGFAPVRDRFKIFIIDEAHMVTNQGFNALLKLVEEPPEHVKFIFATTEPEKVIGTIRSRTHHYPFRLVPPLELEDYLAQLTQAEGVTAGHDLLSLVVRAGTGSVRDTLSVLDQIIGGSEGSVLDYDRAVALLGFTSANLLDDAVAAIAERDGAALFGVVDAVVKSGHDPRRFVEDLLQRLRDLVIISLAGDEAKDVFVSVPEDQYGRMVEQATKLGASRASQAADLTNEALSDMAGATAPRLQLELLCARLIVARSDGERARSSEASQPEQPSADIAQNLAKYAKPPQPKVEKTTRASGRRDDSTMDPRNRPMPAIPDQPAPEPNGQEATAERPEVPRSDQGAPAGGLSGKERSAAQVESTAATEGQTGVAQSEHVQPEHGQPGSGPLDQIRQNWDSIIADAGLSKIAQAQLAAANGPVAVENDMLIVGFDQPGVASAFSARGAREVEQLLSQNLGMTLKVEGRAGGESPAPKVDAAPGAAAPQQADARQPADSPASIQSPGPQISDRAQLDTPTPSPVLRAVSAPSPDNTPTETASAKIDAFDDADILGSAAENFPGPPPLEDPFGNTDPYVSTVSGRWAQPEREWQTGGTDVVDPEPPANELPANEPVDYANPEWDGASADDPEISHSSIVGLQVVLDRFNAKVIEERMEE